MASGSTIGGEALLLPAIAMAAIGVGLVLLLLQRLRRLADERTSLGATFRAIRELEAKQDRLSSVLDDLPDPVVARDREGRIFLANRSFERLLADSGAQVDAARAAPVVVEVASVEERLDGTRRIDEAIGTADGVRWFSWTEREVAREDGTWSILRSGREITDRVASERALDEARTKAEAASEAKSRFLATISHEFRTPLNGILGMSDLLLGTPLAPDQTAYIQALRGSAEAFLSLIEEILDFSKIEAGKMDLAHEPFELEPVVQGVVELLAPRAQDKGVEIACFVARDVPRVVRSDRDRLRQVLFNLAGNAVKFTESGGACISVERGRGAEIVFTVEDTGPGIPADRLPSIFEEFEQGGPAVSRQAGTGLGLAITRRIVDRMSGTIEAESHPGRGSTFRVRIPLEAAAEPCAEAQADRADGMRVLLVGASAFELRCIERRLAEAGGQTARVADLAEAKACMEERSFDILLADGALGRVDSAASAQAARERGVGRSIVLLSPFERRAFGPAEAAGYDAFLMKPVRSRSLFERLRPQERSPRLRSQPPAPQTGAPASGRLPRVLLAEDNDVNALLAMKALEKLGAFVDWARDGTDALRLAEASLSGERPPYDLILMDMRMPGLDGSEVTRLIREREAASGREERCRIVALTASVVGGRERYRETAGFDGFLPKPFSPEQLAAELPSRVEHAVAA